MPVDRPHIPPHSIDCDDFLTPGLDFLAARLSREANHLASCYPPCAPQEADISPAVRMPRGGAWLHALRTRLSWWPPAAALLLAAGASFSAWKLADRGGPGSMGPESPHSVAPLAGDEASSAATYFTHALSEPRRPGSSVPEGVNPALLPAASPESTKLPVISFTRLSPQEQEAVLDLLEDYDLAAASLSL